jgi:putative membrane protein
MKAFLRHILINLLVVFLVDACYPGFSILHDTKTLLTAAVVWFFLNKIVKPIIKLLLLPINLITLNLFSWVVGIITLFLLPLIAGGIQINPYLFPGFHYQGFSIPPININLFMSFIVTSTLLNFFHSFIMWVIRKD